MALRSSGVLAQLDPSALARGVLIALAVVGPAAGLSIALIDTTTDDGSGGLRLLFYVVILVGFGLGGWQVARTVTEVPITHGAFVGLLTFALVQAVVLTGSAAVGRDGPVSAAALAFSALMASSAGMIGATLGLRRQRRWHH
jgi:hypothetical protein